MKAATSFCYYYFIYSRHLVVSAHSRYLILYFTETPLIKIISLFYIPPERKKMLIKLQHAEDHKQILISEMIKCEEREGQGRKEGERAG